MRAEPWITFVMGVALTFGGCQRAADSTDTVGAPEPKAALAPTSRTREPAERKLVRSAEMRLEVDSYAPARRAIDAILKEVGGFVARSEVTHGDKAKSSAKLELRVPNEKLDAAMRRASELGTVLTENVGTRDVTEEHQDLAARAASAKKLEQRLLELAATETQNVKDVLEVERELGRVREQAELMEGKLELLADQVTLSQLTIELLTRDGFARGEPSSLGGQMSRTLSGSIAAMLTLGRGLLLVATALAPWFPGVLLAGYLGVRLLRYSSRRVHG
jgi:hypothetical protein